MAFKPVSPQVDFPKLEKDLLDWWYSSGVVQKYLDKNKDSRKKFSFLDGPITANNPMGVHHARGRTYKDLWQRYRNMKGEAGRFQNGFDCQGLWVEVEVEKELGFKSKKDIEAYGVADFVNKCKERVLKYSAVQTEQSKRLGYFMDWDHSYFTMSDENNYAIWNFLKVCYDRGWLYKGHDSVPWCPRCETAISQHEILTEDYKELTHESVYLKLPLSGRAGESLLVWTTTPWTIPANIAVAVDPKLEYALVDGMWVAAYAVSRIFGTQAQVSRTVPGKILLGLKYLGPYDQLPAVQSAAGHPKFHTVVATDPKILPVTTDEGTGLVHTAVSAGTEDFKLGRKLGLPMIPVIADNADYLPGLGELSGQNAKNNPRLILDYLESENWAWKIENYTHRYPVCWRCKTELVWKVADEWYIAMDQPDPTDPKQKSLRQQMIAVAKKVKWLPAFGLGRELDWLKNMHDWLISKKNRYWGLALPIFECPACGHFQVIGSREELQSRAVSGWDKFAGNSPHRPWVDEVKISCSTCSAPVSRIADVGNPWLDAGIVAVSTLPPGWFPADFITECFPGQFKNWFYALIAMSTVMAKNIPAKTILGFESVVGEDGRPMHKSLGNAIEFNEAADKIGADVMRWMYSVLSPTDVMKFGFKSADETRRRLFLTLWNVYNFFVTYANIDDFKPTTRNRQPATDNVLDRWILARLNQTIITITKSLDKFDAFTSSRAVEDFVSDLSLWYVRRSRDRVGPSADNSPDKDNCHAALHFVLISLSRILAPFTPFISEEIYRNLTAEESVHLADWPKASQPSPAEIQLIEDMKSVRKIVEQGLAKRKEAHIKVRQPLRTLRIKSPAPAILNSSLIRLIKDELNIKEIAWEKGEELAVELDLELDDRLRQEGETRELIRQIQDVRKKLGARLDQKIRLTLPAGIPDTGDIVRHTLAADVKFGDTLRVELI